MDRIFSNSRKMLRRCVVIPVLISKTKQALPAHILAWFVSGSLFLGHSVGYYLDPCHGSARDSVADAGHCFRRVEEPIHSVLFFEPTGSLPFDQADVFVWPTLKHLCVTRVYEPSLTYLKPWHHVLFGVMFATSLGPTSMLPLSRRRAKKRKKKTHNVFRKCYVCPAFSNPAL